MEGWVEGGVNKGTMTLPALWEKAVPPVFALKPDSSVPPHLYLAHFELRSQHWSSEQVSLSVSNSLLRPLRGAPGILSLSLIHI